MDYAEVPRTIDQGKLSGSTGEISGTEGFSIFSSRLPASLIPYRDLGNSVEVPQPPKNISAVVIISWTQTPFS